MTKPKKITAAEMLRDMASKENHYIPDRMFADLVKLLEQAIAEAKTK